MPTKKVILESRLKGADKTKQGLKGIDGGLKSLGKSAIGVAGAYFGAMGLINAIKGSVEAFGQQELAEKKLEAALGRTSPALLKQAAALQKVTTFGDEATIEAMSLLAAFTDEEEQIKKLTPVILDLAAAKGMDLTAAADLVSKSVFSSTNALSRYGIEIKGAVGGTERLDSAVNNISALFGGQATAQADTYAGSVAQMKNSLGDMAEDIGKIVVPIFNKLKPHLELAIEFWGDYLNKGEENTEGQKRLSEEVKKLNTEIELQQSLVDYISSESYAKWDMVRKRAADSGRKLTDQLSYEGEVLADHQKTLDDLIQKRETQLKIEEAVTKSITTNNQLRREQFDLEIEYVNVIDPTITSNNLFAESFESIASAASTSLRQTSDLLASTSGESRKQQIQAMRLAQFAAVASTSAGVMKAFEQGGTLGFITGAGILATGAAQVATIQNAISEAKDIKAAALGANEVVNRPTLFLTGEAGPEHVQVTPLTPGMNQNGPQGGVTIQIQGNMIGNESFVRDTLIPEISKATQQGLA